ncbi:hypothetical protein IDJ75_08335 [Mucilaginibacter rigui]|uniref:Outer membrane protein beta-barrel domain-containing protein n=1 Tax=Mucilaginibacter rigui TaxID=534635 RepID=A0ABR7X3W6_9SPHI|nr:hypothetical protein [Mucilaginibacter rigui]MBD1385283.1 hypothetical protein [Mucilaginibacter rigui]
MNNLNLSKLLFIPLLCAGITASAQTNSLTGITQPEASSNPTAVLVNKSVNFTPLASGKNLFEQKAAFKNVAAADASSSTFNFGLELEGLLPVGNFKDATSAGLGVNAVGLYHIGDIGAVTGSVGYNYFLKKEDAEVKYSGIPIKVGFLAKFGGMFFVEPQVGVYNLRVSDEDDNSASNTNLLLAAKVGLNIGEKSHLGVGYNYIKVTGGSYAFAGVSYLFTF